MQPLQHLVKEIDMKDIKRECQVKQVYGITNRVLHWIRAISIVLLTITGFYIADPFLAPMGDTKDLILGQWSMWHYIFGFIFTSGAILRIYLFYFGEDKEGELKSMEDVKSVDSWITQLKSYFFIGKLDKKGSYGPLQFIIYALITGLILLSILTGLILYSNVYHQGLGGMLYEPLSVVTTWFGGLAQVRLIHHLTMWGFILVVPVHVYMVIWSSIRFKQNGIDVMFTGYDYHLKNEKS